MTAATAPVLIPTPQDLRWLGGAPKRFERGATYRVQACDLRNPQVALAVRLLREHLREQAGVRLQVVEAGRSGTAGGRACDVLLCGSGDPRVRARLPLDLPEPGGGAPEQGYVLHAAADSPVVLYAARPSGLLYATVTLLQLFEPAAEGVCLRNVAITDSPAFRWRGSNWSLFGEIGGWSYERGDGRVAFERRLLRKLDLCLRYKANLVIVDGLGWNPERFPGYGAMMRRLNRAARLRGIHLLYTGYGSGYGCPSHDGPVFRNRHRYPDGPVYACCGLAEAISATMGTCLSNPDLLRLKQANLVEFVRRVEPGALYIHNLDASVLKESAVLWATRCPDCRRRWPNDALAAPDGMAGAFAWFYDQLATAINAVRNPQSGYAARRDCLLMMVSPNYADCSEDDAAWQAYGDYYAVVGRALRHPNVVLGLREQFCNHRAGGQRFGQLRQRLDRDGARLAFGTIAFTGGDGYYNNVPFLATPVLSGCFLGANLVVHAHGNGYQEAQQLLNAEYSWNPTGSAFHREPLPTGRDEWWPRYLALSSGRARPAGLFGPGGFLDVACGRLYGERAGRLVARVWRLRGRTDLRALSPRFDRPSVLLPVWTTLMPAGRFSTFRRLGVSWRQDADATTWARARVLRRACAEMAALNRRAARLAARAGQVCEAGREVCDDLAWLTSTLGVGATFAQCTAEYLRLLASAHLAVARGPGPARRRVVHDIAALRRRLGRLPARLARLAPARTLDFLGGDVGFRQELLVFLRAELGRMDATLSTNAWVPPPRSTWW